MSKEIVLPNREKLDAISVDLTKYSETATNLVAQAERAEITDEDTYAKGGDLIRIAGVQVKKVDAERTKLSGPFHAMWKFINGRYGTIKTEFGVVRSTIEPKMLAWKREEDKRLAEEARVEAKKIEDEALARAALEKTDEGQDEVMDDAAEAAKDIVKDSGVGIARGDFGASTSSVTRYSTEVTDLRKFLQWAISQPGGNLDNLVELRKGGLNTLAKHMIVDKEVSTVPGAKFIASDALRVF